MSTSRDEHLAPPGQFAAPWQLRAFALATVLGEQRVLDGAVLQERVEAVPLPQTIGAGAGADEHLRLVAGLEACLCDGGHLSVEELMAEVERQRAAAARSDHDAGPAAQPAHGGSAT